MSKVNVLILTGFGINAEEELAECFKRAGGCITLKTIYEFISADKNLLEEYDILAFPGGFSYGDHLGAGMILANQLKMNRLTSLKRFVASGKPVIGICNGFQILMALGVFSWNDVSSASANKSGKIQNSLDLSTTSGITLSHNDSNRFENRWIYVRANEKNNSFWLRGLTLRFPLPVRHGEGKIIVRSPVLQTEIKDKNLIALHYADEKGNATMTYPANPNGSFDAIAGLTNDLGNVLGLMPHPEAFMIKKHFPGWRRENDFYNHASFRYQKRLASILKRNDGYGMMFFKNAINYVRQIKKKRGTSDGYR